MVSGSLKFFCNFTTIPSGWHKFHEKLQINVFTRPKEKTRRIKARINFQQLTT